MRKLTLSLLTLSLGVALLPLAQAATTPAQEHLLEQVRLGEASNREDLVRQSLYRLELIDPNNPELIAARMRYLLRQGDAAGAQKELERLTKLAPDSPELKASRNEMKSNTGEGRQALQQARLLGVAGKVDEAIAAYEKLYGGVPDDVDVAIEYWTLVARLPSRHSEGVSQLKKLNASAPGNVSLLTSLAKQMFADNKPQEGFAYLAEMARSASGRGIAADMWFSEVKSMPVSKASVQALQQFLLQFPTERPRSARPTAGAAAGSDFPRPLGRAGGGQVREYHAGGRGSAESRSGRQPRQRRGGRSRPGLFPARRPRAGSGAAQ